jgi:hypothetical protein
MAYIRKTVDEFDIEADYGHGQGFEMVTCETTFGQALQTKRDYKLNEPGIPFRIVHHRVRKVL